MMIQTKSNSGFTPLEANRPKAAVVVPAAGRPLTGFTLIEMLITIALFAIIMLVLFNLFDWHNRLFYFQQAQVYVSGSARSSLNDLSNYIAQSQAVLASHTFSGTNYNSGANVLVLQLPSADASGNILASTFDYVVFYTSSNQLMEQVAPAAGSFRTQVTKQLSDTLNTITFTYDNADFTQVKSVTVNIATQAKAGKQTVNYTLNQKVFLRNH